MRNLPHVTTTSAPTNNRRSPAIATLVVLAATLLLASACNGPLGGDDGAIHSGVVVQPASSDGQQTTGSATTASAVLDDIPTQPYVESSTRAVVVGDALDVLDGPDGRPLTTLAATTGFGTTRVLLVEDQVGDWVKVRLPTRPNHRSGWVASADVQLEAVAPTVYVDLQARTLTVLAGGDIVLRSSIAVGTAENPTPAGTFYVTDKLETPDPAGAYGPYALGLSGFSETLTEFAGGDGQIGIHGTNDPSSIGQAVSFGCVRLPNELVTELAALLPLGTPVHIV